MTAKKKSHDWEKIEIAYCTGAASLRVLSKQYAVSYTALSRRSKLGSWGKKRIRFKAELVSKSRGKILASAVLDLTAFNLKCESICDATIDAAFKAISKAKAKGETAPDGYRKHLDNARAALDLKRKALGLPERSEFKGEITTTTNTAEVGTLSQIATKIIMENRETRDLFVEAMAVAGAINLDFGKYSPGDNLDSFKQALSREYGVDINQSVGEMVDAAWSKATAKAKAEPRPRDSHKPRGGAV